MMSSSGDLRSLTDTQDVRAESAAMAVPPRSKPGRSRIGGLWIAGVTFAAVLLVLLIFVLENGQRADVSFFGAHGHLPLGVALLLAAIFGVLLVALPGTARIVQLRISGRRSRAGTPVQSADDGPAVAPDRGLSRHRRP